METFFLYLYLAPVSKCTPGKKAQSKEASKKLRSLQNQTDACYGRNTI